MSRVSSSLALSTTITRAAGATERRQPAITRPLWWVTVTTATRDQAAASRDCVSTMPHPCLAADTLL